MNCESSAPSGSLAHRSMPLRMPTPVSVVPVTALLTCSVGQFITVPKIIGQALPTMSAGRYGNWPSSAEKPISLSSSCERIVNLTVRSRSLQLMGELTLPLNSRNLSAKCEAAEILVDPAGPLVNIVAIEDRLDRAVRVVQA